MMIVLLVMGYIIGLFIYLVAVNVSSLNKEDKSFLETFSILWPAVTLFITGFVITKGFNQLAVWVATKINEWKED